MSNVKSHVTAGGVTTQVAVNDARVSPAAPAQDPAANDATDAPVGSTISNDTSPVNEPTASITISVAKPSQRSTETDPEAPEANVAVATVTPFCTKPTTFPFQPSPHESFMLNVNVHWLDGAQFAVLKANGPTQVLTPEVPQSACT